MVLDGVPEFDSSYSEFELNYSEYSISGFSAGFRNALKWGGSIGDSTNVDLWTHLTCTEELGTYGSVLNRQPRNYDAILDWLKEFSNCRAVKDGDKFKAAYEKIIPYVDLAIEHKVATFSNPVAGATQLRHANTCYVWSNGSCTSTTPQTLCSEQSCIAEVYNSAGTVLSDRQVPRDLSSAFFLQQIVYVTYVGMAYDDLRFGKYGSGNRYFMIEPIGNGITGTLISPALVDNQQLINSLTAHWNRLNRDRHPELAPQAFVPSFCMTGISHVIRVETNAVSWQSFTFNNGDVSSDAVTDVWYCQ